MESHKPEALLGVVLPDAHRLWDLSDLYVVGAAGKAGILTQPPPLGVARVPLVPQTCFWPACEHNAICVLVHDSFTACHQATANNGVGCTSQLALLTWVPSGRSTFPVRRKEAMSSMDVCRSVSHTACPAEQQCRP